MVVLRVVKFAFAVLPPINNVIQIQTTLYLARFVFTIINFKFLFPPLLRSRRYFRRCWYFRQNSRSFKFMSYFINEMKTFACKKNYTFTYQQEHTIQLDTYPDFHSLTIDRIHLPNRRNEPSVVDLLL